MNKLQASLYLFLILLIIIFLIDYVFIKRKHLKETTGKKKNKKDSELIEILYLSGKFNLEKNKLNTNGLLIGISFINAFIISLVAVVVLMLNIYILFQLLIGFILLIALIYSIYELLGRYLVKKESR